MPLIRSTEPHGSKTSGTPLDLGDLRRRAELLQSQARDQARAILEEARAERERLITGAAEKGHAEGLEKGLAEGRTKGEAEGRAQGIAEMRDHITRIQEAWGDALVAFLDVRDALLREARQDLLAVAARVASLATRRTVELDPEIVRDQLEEVLARVLEPTRLRIRVNPDDLARATEIIPELTRRFGDSMHAELVESADLSQGSVVVETERGAVDSSMDTRLVRLIDALLPPASGAPAAEPTP